MTIYDLLYVHEYITRQLALCEFQGLEGDRGFLVLQQELRFRIIKMTGNPVVEDGE